MINVSDHILGVYEHVEDLQKNVRCLGSKAKIGEKIIPIVNDGRTWIGHVKFVFGKVLIRE